jgi:hypothetical protein
MTQTPVLEPPTAPDWTRRFIPITADLLPTEIVESRRARKVRRSVLAGLVALLVVLTGWYGFAVYQTSAARGDLNSANADITRLKSRQDQFRPLVQAQTEKSAIDGQLSALMATDLSWSALVGPALADGAGLVEIDDVTGALTDPKNVNPGLVTLPNTTGRKLIGKFTVKGAATTKDDVARYVDALARVPGLGNPFVSNATPDETTGKVDYTIQLDVTDAALGGRFTTKSEKK